MEEMDKLLEDLQKVSVDFNDQLSKYEALIYHTRQTNDKLTKYTESNREKVDRLCIRVENRLTQINEQVEAIAGECKEVFAQYSVEVASLSEQERQAFCELLLKELEHYKKDFLRDVLGDYQKILQVFLEKIQKESAQISNGQKDFATLVRNNEENNQELVTQIHGLRVIVNGCLEAINHTVAGMNDSYMTIFGEFSKQVNEVNKQDREHFVNELSRTLDVYKEDFGIYGITLQESRKLNRELSELTLKTAESVQAMQQEIAQKQEQTKKLMEHISQSYEKGFNSFAKDVTSLNSREKENFVVAVRSMLEEYRFSFGKEIESKTKEMNSLLKNTLVGSCNAFASKIKEYQNLLENTRNSNVELHDILQRTLMEIEGLTISLMRREEYIHSSLEFLKEDYKTTVRAYVEEIEKSNKTAREQWEKTALKSTSATMERFLHQLELFKNERSTYKHQIENLLKEERKDREELLCRQAEMINKLKEEQLILKDSLEQKQAALSRYQMVMSGVTVGLLVICILLQIPWENTKMVTFVGLPIVILIGILLIVFRKHVAMWFQTIMKKENHKK